ncbi:MAG: methyl-accepting chemotaxis protein [Alphaproteobacteria bacterium]|nr:methyl-accepting chemotaxis protein [Alphaproteobacteria bacterium]
MKQATDFFCSETQPLDDYIGSDSTIGGDNPVSAAGFHGLERQEDAELIKRDWLAYKNSLAQLKDQHFTLASGIKLQSDQLIELVTLIGAIHVGNRTIALPELTALFSASFKSFTQKILQSSKLSMSLMYKMDEAVKHLSNLEPFIAKIQAINRQANLLSLNATIESARFGKAGEGFAIVAQEIRDVSRLINQVTEEMRRTIQSAQTRVADGYAMLGEITALDMSEQLREKADLEQMLQALEAQTQKLSQHIQQSGSATHDIYQTLSELDTSALMPASIAALVEAYSAASHDRPTTPQPTQE